MLLMMDLYKQTPDSLLKAGLPVLQAVWEEAFSPVFHGLGTQLAVGCWWMDPLQTDRPGTAEEGAEDKAGERSPGASVGRTLPSVTKTGGSRHLLLLLQLKPLSPATPSTSSSSEAPPRPRRDGP